MRNQETTKNDYGHGLLIAGSHGRMGCAILAARAALRSGCGLVSVHLPGRCVNPMQAAFPEAMVSIDPSPTLFTSVPEHLVHALLQSLHSCHQGPLVLDADALNILARHRDWLTLATGAIVTPHTGEYERLFGDANPAEMARKHNLIIVKKAHHTQVFSPDGETFSNHTGNAGMATAGSGDVLTGILLGMLCSNQLHSNPFDIACRAVSIHGQIGDIAIETQSESSLTASDLVENLRHVSTDITTL